MRFIKLKSRYLNLDNISQVRAWRTADGNQVAEVTFLAASDPEVRASLLPLRLIGEEAEALMDWLDHHVVVDLSESYYLR